MANFAREFQVDQPAETAGHNPSFIMSEPREVFLEELMTHIMDLTMIPKVQVERAIGPILGMFLAELLSTLWTKTLGHPVQVEMICEEFPLRKAPGTCQSTNIDWLLYNVSDDELVFLELKTADTSFDPLQEDAYLDLIKRIGESESESLFLFTDLEEIMEHSLEPKKYGKVLECVRKCVEKNPRLSNCRKAKLVYLAPAAIHPTTPRPGVKWMSFGDLPDRVSDNLAVEWGIIRRALVKLDSITRHSRNGAMEGGNRRNYGDTRRFEEMVRLCEESGNTILVGFEGGARKLRAATLDELKNRQAFKWDYTEGGTGFKDTRNWIPGQQFLRIIEGLTDDATAG